MENSRNKQFISFKLCTVMSSMRKSLTIQLHPELDTLPTDSHLVAVLVITEKEREGEGGTEREGETNHIHITFITIHCYNCSILLLVVVNYNNNTVPNLQVSLYRRCVCIKKKQYIQGFRPPSGICGGSWNVSAAVKGGLL